RPLEQCVAFALPRRGEASLREPLREDAQPGAIPEQHLRASAILAHEHVERPVEDVVFDLLANDRRQRVERLAHVRGLAVREHANPSRPVDHDNARNKAANDTASPSITSPLAACIARSVVDCASTMLTGINGAAASATFGAGSGS